MLSAAQGPLLRGVLLGHGALAALRLNSLSSFAGEVPYNTTIESESL